MKPLNLDNSPCSPISSNCVIWQGPDIPCIKLCKGDTVSDVVHKLATELCTILDTLNITNYDLSCFNLINCPPSDFEALINFLIQRICELENIPTPTPNPSTSCADTLNCQLTAADCFGGGPIALGTYVQNIATEVCNIVDQIAVINVSLTLLQNDVNFLLAQFPIVFPPTPGPVTTTCTIGTLLPGTYAIDVLLDEFINNVWCAFEAVMGTTADLLTAVSSQCVTTTSTTMAFRITDPARTMLAEYGGSGFTNGTTIAEVIQNLWISICDLRDIELMGYAVTASDDITVTTTVVGATTTFDIGRTPIISYYAESVTPIYLQNSVAPQAYVDNQYFQPNGYTTLGYTNTSGVTKDYFVRVSYDTNVIAISVNSATISNDVDGALIKNGNTGTPVYQSLGTTLLSGFLFNGPTTSDVVNTGTAETVVTTPSADPVEFRFLNGSLPRNVSFFKKVTLNAGETIELMFRGKGGAPNGYLLQAQFYVEEIR